jgi:hypothetical protein
MLLGRLQRRIYSQPILYICPFEAQDKHILLASYGRIEQDIKLYILD